VGDILDGESVSPRLRMVCELDTVGVSVSRCMLDPPLCRLGRVRVERRCAVLPFVAENETPRVVAVEGMCISALTSSPDDIDGLGSGEDPRLVGKL
jgi:hypothetical protein